ncbi:TPA: AIPR family protein, partial [Vibrio cholerae]
NLEDASKLRSSDLDFSVLFDNVRGLVKRSKYNENIANSLKVEPKKFFMYNNGITLIAEDIKSKPLPGNKSIKLELSGMQIVNGGQTLRTIHKFNQDDDGNLENYLYDAEVLVRMFMPDNELNESHKIAEYTNSQNPIKSIDLKSLASEQIEIERYLDEFDIAYARKSGDTGPKDDKEYKYTVNMELLGKLLKAKAGNPDKTTSSVKDMFEGGYNKLFVTNFELTETPELIDMYFNIVKVFKDLKIKGNQLKYFYIVYLSYLIPNMSLPELIDKLETSLNEYLINQPDTTAVKALGSALFKRTLLNALELQLES